MGLIDSGYLHVAGHNIDSAPIDSTMIVSHTMIVDSTMVVAYTMNVSSISPFMFFLGWVVCMVNPDDHEGVIRPGWGNIPL